VSKSWVEHVLRPQTFAPISEAIVRANSQRKGWLAERPPNWLSGLHKQLLRISQETNESSGTTIET